MRAIRPLSLLLAGTMLTLTLAGCFAGREVETKTTAIAQELEGMAGVLAVEPSYRELGIGTPRYSTVWVTLAPDADEVEVLAILRTFAAADQATGTEKISTLLQMVIHTADPLVSERLTLHVPGVDERQLSDLARAWFELRSRYSGNTLEMIKPLPGGHPFGFDVTIRMPEGSDAASDLAAIRDVAGVFAGIGPVVKVFEVGGPVRSQP